MPMSYEEDRAAPNGAMRRSAGPALLANQGRAVQQGPANFAGRARPGYQRPGTNAQPYQPADRAFARGPGPAPAPPPRPAATPGATPGATAPTDKPVVRPNVTIAGKFGAMGRPAYNGMMRGNLSTLNLQDALGRSQGSAQDTIRSQGQQADEYGLAPTAQVIPQQPLTSNASVLGGAPANMAVGGAGTAQGSVQGLTFSDVGNRFSGEADNVMDQVRQTIGGSGANNGTVPAESGGSGSYGAGQSGVSDWSYNPSIQIDPAAYLDPGSRDDGIGGGNGGASTPIGAALRDILRLAGGDLNAASGAMSETDMANIRKHFGESAGAYSDIINRSRDIMDPAKMAEAEAAARGDLYSGINTQRDAAQRQMLAASGRGGYQSSGAQTGIYNAAMQAAQAGERGLAQDAFGRRQAATQLGISGLGAGGSALENLLQSGFTSNKELMAMLLGAGKQAKDNLNPFSFTNL